ncbi:autotransporter-associated beta strand repeat-containing protein, partial [Ereboglobus sp. PH5-5]|uniref:beta strand repeat-containing protein n=1 Tax=Ereboglobus sp. PH5-5 TaxID=2940529 RepID=UPI002405634B
MPNAVDATAIISNDLSSGNHTISIANPGVTVGALSIEGNDSAASTITIQTSTLSFAATGGQNAVLNYQGSNYVTISSVVNLLSDLSIQAGTDPLLPAFASRLTISGRIDGNGHAINVNAGHAPAITTISGAITGAGTQLIKTGGGALVLSNSNNTFSGGLDVFVGSVTTTIGNRANAGTVLGAGVAATGSNYLGIGDIKVANSDALLTINSAAGNYAGQHVTLGGGLILLENGGDLRISENDARTTFRFNFNSGTISGGTNPNRGTLTLAGADFVYNADGSGGTLFENAPTLVFDTSRNTTAMNVKMNNTAMLGAFGVVRKTGTNALTFTAGDTGAFRADDFVIESGLGAITLNQTALDLANGLTFSGTNASFTNMLALPTGSVSFGRADQLSNSSALNIGQNVITNLLLNGYDQTFSSINLATDARLGIWMSAGTPSTLTIGGLTSSVATPTAGPLGANYLSIYNWKGNPGTHLLDGSVVSNGNIVKDTGGVDLGKVWFRGYAPGAVLDPSGNLVPVDFLRTTVNTNVMVGNNWFTLSNWSVDVPDTSPGAVVEITGAFGGGKNLSLQNRTVTIGHLIANRTINVSNQSTINTGVIVFDSGVAGTASTISGTGGITLSAAVRLDNDLLVNATGGGTINYDFTNIGTYIQNALSGSGNIEVRGSGLIINSQAAKPDYSGNIDVYSKLGVWSDTAGSTSLGLGTGAITMHQGSWIGNWVSTRKPSIIYNKFVINGGFTMHYAFVNYAGDVELTEDRAINVSASQGYGSSYGEMSGFGAGANLTGVGGLGWNGSGMLKSGSNTFSGGLKKTGAAATTLYADLHSDLVTGALAPGNNYLGSGDITITGGIVRVNTFGHDVSMLGNVSIGAAASLVINNPAGYAAGDVNISGNLVLGANSVLQFINQSAVIADTATWTNTGLSRIVFAGDLAINTPFGGTYSTDLRASASVGGEQHLTSTLAGGISNVGTLYKEAAYGGNTWLDTEIHLNAVNIAAGSLIINGDNLIRSRTGVAPATTLTMSGGLVQVSGGSAGAPNTNTFTTLTISGNAGLFLDEHSALYFTGVSNNTWGNTNAWHVLNLANSTGEWTTAADNLLSDTYVYFSNTTQLTATRLGLISFTGFGTGAKLVQTNISGTNYWFLAPTGEKTLEWAGARTTGVDTDRLWSSAANWIGVTGGDGSVTGAGLSVAIRNVDGLLDGNRIIVDQDVTVGKLYIESSGGQVFTLSSTNDHTLTFDSGVGGSNAMLVNNSAHSGTITANLALAGTLEIANHSPTANPLVISSHITGSGGIVYDATGFLIMGDAAPSSSDFTGGFKIVGSTATSANAAGSRIIRLLSDGSVFGSGSYNGVDAKSSTQALTIGAGVAGRWYTLQTGSTGSSRTIDGSVRFAGDLFYSAASGAGTLTFESAAPSYVTTGTWRLHGNNGWTLSTLNLKTDLQGDGGFIFGTYTQINFYGDNTFSGGVVMGVASDNRNTRLGIGSDTALGVGKLTLASNTAENNWIYALGGARSITNEIAVTGSGLYQFASNNLTFARVGSSTLQATFKLTVANGITVTFSDGHVLTGAHGIIHSGAGTLRFEGANAYTGNTSISNGTLSVGDNLSIGGSGTLIFGGASAGTLASHGGAITLSNDVLFSGAYIGLNGSAGLLTLDPGFGVTLNNNKTIAATGTAALGANLTLAGDYGVTKTGVGTLVINSRNSTYTGNTAITQGTLRVNAAGDITLGEADAGNNYLGTGHVTFTSGNYARLLELVTTDGSSVNLHGNLALNGNTAVNTASINITDTAGAISGANIDTKIVTETNSTISGNAYGYLRTAGDVIKTGTATLHWTGGNIVTPNFILREGALDLGSANSTRTGLGSFTLGTATFNVSGSQTFAGTIFNLAGSGTINMNGASGSSLLTFQNLGSWNGTLDIINWNGNSTYGGGATQVRFVSDVLNAFDYARLAAISFYSSGVITYAPGAKILKNTQQFYELIPLGVSAEWVGDASGNNWGNTANWKGNISPTGPGAVAVFSNTLQLGGDPVHIDVANLKLGGLMFTNNTGENYSLDGQSITFEQMDSDEVANLTLQNNNSVTIANAGVALSNRLVVSTVGTGTLTINAPVSGTQGMIKSGAGELVLANNANDFSGGITLLDGTLTAAASSSVSSGSVIAGPLGTGTLTVAGTLAPTLAFALNGAQTIDNAIDLATQLDGTDAVDITLKLDTASGNETTLTGGITQTGSGAGSLEKTGAGELVLAAASAHTGTTTVSAGTLAFTAANAIASSTAVIVNAALFTGDIEQTLVNLSGTGHIIAGADGNDLTGHVIALNTESTTYSGSITGDGALTKTGTGALTLSGVNTHTGTTAIHDGMLVAATAGGDTGRALGAGDIFYTNALGSTLRLEGGGTLNQSQHVVAGASGTVQVANGGTLVITASRSPALFAGEDGVFTSVGNITFLDSWEANRHGAAVYADTGATLSFNSGTVEFVNGFIYEIGQGGAIYASGSLAIAASQAEIIFQGNQAYRGGAIFAEDSVSIDAGGSSLLFASNTAFAIDEGHSFLSAGGAVFTFDDFSINITNGGTLAFLNNYAHEVGGAIASGTETNNPGDYAAGVSITGDYGRIEMSGNVALSGGGAIWSAGTVAISATSGALIVTSNTVLESIYGSAIYSSEGDIIISGSYGLIEIADNVIVESDWQGGGALSAPIGDIVINPAATGTLSIVSNTSGINGGALYTEEGGIMIGGNHGAMFINSNNAVDCGGAFYSEEGDIVIDSIVTGTLSIASNTADSRGGAFYTNGGDIEITGTYGGIFINSNTSANGGAFYASRGFARFSATTSGDLRITDNYASNGGGAIVAHGGVVMDGAYGNILINSNTAGSYASVVYSNTGSVVISATTSGSLEIANNTAPGSYGAIYAGNGFSVTGDYDAVSITGNTSGTYSGAVYTPKNIVITPGAAETLVIADNAAAYGGAFFSTGTTIIGGGAKNISITGNTVSLYGGAIYAGAIVIAPDAAESIVIASNTASYGGAFYSGGGFTLTLADGAVFTATNNKTAANTRGGFLYAAGGGMRFDIGANATAQIGDANSIAATADSISGGASVS